MGFFAWIREGVRRAVLMGFSDAVEEIGKRTADDDLSPQMAMALRESVAIEVQPASQPKLVAAASGARPARKRLGRSLEQIREGAAKPA